MATASITLMNQVPAVEPAAATAAGRPSPRKPTSTPFGSADGRPVRGVKQGRTDSRDRAGPHHTARPRDTRRGESAHATRPAKSRPTTDRRGTREATKAAADPADEAAATASASPQAADAAGIQAEGRAGGASADGATPQTAAGPDAAPVTFAATIASELAKSAATPTSDASAPSNATQEGAPPVLRLTPGQASAEAAAQPRAALPAKGQAQTVEAESPAGQGARSTSPNPAGSRAAATAPATRAAAGSDAAATGITAAPSDDTPSAGGGQPHTRAGPDGQSGGFAPWGEKPPATAVPAEANQEAPAKAAAAAVEPVADGPAAKRAIAQAAEAARADAATAAPVESGSGPGPKGSAGIGAGAAGRVGGAASARDNPSAGPLADQVAEGIRASGGRTDTRIEVRLHPPELGRVRVTLRAEGDAIRGLIRVDTPETLSRLQQEAAPLLHRLQADGIDIRRLDVLLNQPQDGGQGQGDFAFSEGRGDSPAWSAHAGGDTLADHTAPTGGPPEPGTPDEPAGTAGAAGGSVNVQA